MAFRSTDVCYDHQQLAGDCGCANDDKFCPHPDCGVEMVYLSGQLYCPFSDEPDHSAITQKGKL